MLIKELSQIVDKIAGSCLLSVGGKMTDFSLKKKMVLDDY